jgi:small subunit ribosomal protein S3
VGQKVHPKGLRIGIVKDWDTKWYADKKNFADLLVEDVKIREFVKKTLYNSGVPRIEIERIVTGNTQRVKVTVHTAKPGMVIGRQGAGITDLQTQLEKLTGKSVSVNVVEVKNPEVDATLVAESIAQQLEKRVSFRRAMKQAVQRAMRQGAKGIRVRISGRIGGAEIARVEGDKDGTVPLHTLRADIDYGTAEANTTAGKVGVKVWLYAGEAANQAPRGTDREERGGRGGRRGGERGGRRGGGERADRGNDRTSIAGGPTPRKGGRVDAGA